MKRCLQDFATSKTSGVCQKRKVNKRPNQNSFFLVRAKRLEKSTGTRSGKDQDFDLRVGLGTRLCSSRCPRLFSHHATRPVPDPVIEHRASTARHKLPSWGRVGHAEEVRALQRACPLHTWVIASGLSSQTSLKSPQKPD